MLLNIKGLYFVSVTRDTLLAGVINLPISWLSLSRQASPEIHILSNTPLLLKYRTGLLELISWHNPDSPSPQLHSMDKVEVNIIHEIEFDDDKITMIRFCVYTLAKANELASRESRLGVLNQLSENIDLKKSVSALVLGITENQLFYPTNLKKLFSFKITDRTFQNDLESIENSVNTKNTIELDELNPIIEYKDTNPKEQEKINEAHEDHRIENTDKYDRNTRIAENVYARLMEIDPSLPSMNKVIEILQTRYTINRVNIGNDFIDRLTIRENNNLDELTEITPIIKEYLNKHGI